MNKKLCVFSYAIVMIFVFCSCSLFENTNIENDDNETYINVDNDSEKYSSNSDDIENETENGIGTSDEIYLDKSNVFDTKLENYVDYSMQEIEAELLQYGFILKDQEISDDIISFKFNENSELSEIFLLDTEAVSDWSVFGVKCSDSAKEAEEVFNDIGATSVSHNMQVTSSGIGLETKGIKKINYGNNDKIGYIEIIIDKKNYNNNCLNCYVITKNEKNIDYPFFVGNDDCFESFNKLIEERVAYKNKEESTEKITYKIECLESENISISFYYESGKHFESVFTINYNIITNCENTNCPVEDLEFDDGNIFCWFMNPIQYTVVFKENNQEENTAKTYWRE